MASEITAPASQKAANNAVYNKKEPDPYEQKEIKKFCREIKQLPPLDYDKRSGEIMTQWEPKFPTIALYVRWAKQSCRDYNMDCIALLNTLAAQAGTTPLRFLKDVRVYRWGTMKSRYIKNNSSQFRFSLQFAQRNTIFDKEDDITNDGKTGKVSFGKIGKILTGIKISCFLLNSKMAHDVATTMGVTRLRKKSKDDIDVTDFKVVADNGWKKAYTGVPRFRTHMLQSFVSRVWLEVEFRFLAYEIVKFIFENMLIKNRLLNQKTDLNFDREFYGMSIRVLSNCRERRAGFQVLSNLCLAFGEIKLIYQYARELKMFWDDRDSDQMPGRLRNFAATKAGHTDAKGQAKKIDLIFNSFRMKKKINRNIIPKDKLWFDAIKASTYHYLLELPRTKERCNIGPTLKDEWEAICDRKRKVLPLGSSSSSTRRRVNSPQETDEDGQEGRSVLRDETSREPPAAANTTRPAPAGSLTLSQLINRSQSRKAVTSSTASSALSNNPSYDPMMPLITNAKELEVLEHNIEGGEETDTAGEVCPSRPSILLLHELAHHKERLKGLDLATATELDARVHSELVVQHPNKVYHLGLSPFEVYSAGHLALLAHKRDVSSSIIDTVHLRSGGEADCHEYIGKRKVEHIDPMNVIHVARPDSSIFDSHEGVLGNLDIGLLVETIISSGEPSKENGRSPDSIRWHVAAAGQGYERGSNRPTSNVGFLCKIADVQCQCPQQRKDDALTMIGRICSFIWECLQAMQVRSGQPLLGSHASRKPFSDKIKEFLKIRHLNMGFESITMAIMEIFPSIPRNEEHHDKFNCSLASTNRTGGLDMVILDPSTNRLYLLQFLLNFRVQITNYILPCNGALSNLTNNINWLITRIKANYNRLYLGQQMISDMPTPLDRTGFFLDDSLEYSRSNIQTDGSELAKLKPVYLDLIFLPIGFSRTMSLSAAISSLNESFWYLEFDQVTELCFVSLLLYTPLRFHSVLEKLMQRAGSATGEWNFDSHPFYDWLEETIQTFGCWQGGQFGRYSPFGQRDIADIFGGMKHDCSTVDESEGRGMLHSVVEVLVSFLTWIDNQWGKNHPEDLPIPTVKSRMLQTCQQIKDIVPGMEFSIFHLGIFLTHANGCRLTRSGHHLRNLFFPCTGMASYEHLKDPNGDTMTCADAGVLTDANCPGTFARRHPLEDGELGGVVDDENFDVAMQTISEQFGEKVYHRDTWEVALCESRHSRELGKVDTLVRGVPLYDIDHSGRIVRKQPGRHSRWEVFMGNRGREKQFAFLRTIGQEMITTKCFFHYVRNDNILKFVAKEAGCDDLLRYTLAGNVGGLSPKIKYQTRSRSGKGIGGAGQIYQQNHPLPLHARMRHYHHEIAYFYEEASENIMNTTPNKRMRVLGNGNFGVPVEQCNKMKDVYGYPILCEMLRRSLVELEFVGEGFELAGELHKQTEHMEQKLSYFEVHRDKLAFDFVTFVPLSGNFWTLAAVPTCFSILSENDRESWEQAVLSESEFNIWREEKLDSVEREEVDLLSTQLKRVAEEETKNQVTVRMFHCKVGSMLTFPAHQWHHYTITWLSSPPEPRNTMVFYPLQLPG